MSAAAMALAVVACGGKSGTRTPPYSGAPSDAGASGLDDGSVREADAALVDASNVIDASNIDASNVIDASNIDASNDLDAAADAAASSDADAARDPCAGDGGLAVSGDYTAADGTQYWLRQSATAATFTVVPGGTPSNASPPQLARVRQICSQWLGVAGTDGTFARVDWASADGGLLLCPRTVPSLGAAAALPDANPNDVDAGCGDSTWISVTPVSP